MDPFERHGIRHLSPSSLNLYAVNPCLWVGKYLGGWKDDMGPAGHRGSAIESGLDYWLFQRDAKTAEVKALAHYAELTQGQADDEYEAERANIGPMLSQAITALKDAPTPVGRQLKVEHWANGCEVPIIGYVDYLWEDHGLDLKTTAAEIIGAASTPDFRTVTIDKGSQEGLAVDMAVIAPAGIVGRVVIPSQRASKVQLLIDRNAAAGAIVARSRAQGVVVGTGETRLRMDYVSTSSDVVVGDTVVTSGVDGIYPKGLVIGRVDNIDKTSGAWQIGIVPAVDFSSLEQVLVVLAPTSTSDAPQQGARP